MPKAVERAMAMDTEFKEWVESKVAEKPDRLHQTWFREMIMEWAESILRG